MRRDEVEEAQPEDDAAGAVSAKEEPPRLPVATERGEVELREIDYAETRFVPVYESPLGAGAGGNANLVDPTGYMAFRTGWLRRELQITPERAFVAEVTGQSMLNLLGNGDLVIGEFGDELPRRGLCAAIFDGELLVKTLVQTAGGGVELRSKNEDYGTIVVTPAEVEAGLLHFIGRIRGRAQRM
jgi:phage repressor protein C with HTH and peptisase S24 domain